MANKLFGIADPYYDALRVQSNQAIWPDAGGSPSGLGGVLENKIYVWHADGSTIDTFDPTDTGLTSALAAAASGDTVWIPSFTISGNHTVPAGVGVYGLDRTQTILTGQITLSSGSSLGNLSVSRSGGASNVTCIVGPSSGAARVISCLLLAVTTSGTPLVASTTAANTLYLEDCQISALQNGVSIDPFGASSGTLFDTFSIDSSNSAYQYGSVLTAIGINYRVEVSGDVQYSMPAFPDKKWDANYATTNNWATQTLGLSMEFSDGSRPISNEGTYQGSHVYNFTRPGTGAAFGGRVVDTIYGDNVGSWTVNVYRLTSIYAVNVEGCEFDSTVSGIPQWGDRGAWDTVSYAARHAQDIADGSYTYHNNPAGGGDDAIYLRLDTTNDPLTGSLTVQAAITGPSINLDNIQDASNVNATADNAMFASFDAHIDVIGATNYNHIASHQDRTKYAGSGSLINQWGFLSWPENNGSGTIIGRYGVKINDVLGTGPVTTNYGIYVSALSRGANNYALWVETNLSHFGGIVEVKPTGTAGIRLDPNSATGNFTHSISPANLTGDHRATLQDADGTIAYLSDIISGVTSVTAGTGLTATPSNPITGTGTILDADTGVAAATYGDANNIPQIAVNAQGRITSASNIAISTFTPISVYNETQTADGINTIYYLTNFAAPSTIRVYIDGIRQPATDDTAPTDIVTFTVAPILGALLMFDYEMDQ